MAYFAWVCSPCYPDRVALEETLRHTAIPCRVTFNNLADACDWRQRHLLAQQPRPANQPHSAGAFGLPANPSATAPYLELHQLVSNMQPHSPQLPIDAPASPAPKNLKKGALLLLLVVMGVAALVAFLLPQKQNNANKVPAATQQAPSKAQRAQSGAFKNPTH